MRLEWDKVGDRYYETGVSRGVLYLLDENNEYANGVVWNGLTAVTESPDGAEANDMYADDIKYASLRSAEKFNATIEAYTYPDEFMECDGSTEIVKGVTIGQQHRNTFGFCYRTTIGNDTATEKDDGYKLHLIYGATASPSEKNYQTVNDSPEAITFSWEVETTPVNVAGHKPSANIVVNSLKADPTKLKALEDILYGTEDSEPRLPLPDEVATLMIPTSSGTTGGTESTL